MNVNLTVGLSSGAREEMERHWIPCRALQAGTQGMREARTLLTPMTARESKPASDNLQHALYEARLRTSCLHNVYWQTVTRLAAAPFGKPPTITGTLGPMMTRLVDDADRQGSSLSVFLSRIYQDGVDRGLGMFIVDNVSTIIEKPRIDANGDPVLGPDGNQIVDVETMTRQQQDEADARPYFSRIDPDNFIGARVENRLGREVCVELRVREWAYEPRKDSLKDEIVERVRRYTTDSVELWERIYGAESASTDRTLLAGKGDTHGFSMLWSKPHYFPNGEIPLIVFYTRRIGYAHARPPLLDLAHLNVKHWNQQSVLDSTLRYCLAPTLFGKGMDQEDKERPPTTGEGSRLLSTSEQAELKYVEIAGTSLAMARDEIATTERRMGGMSEEVIQGMATATGEIRADMKENAEAARWIEAMEWTAFQAFKTAEKWGLENLPEDFDIALVRPSAILMATNQANANALQFDVREGIITKNTYRQVRAIGGAYGPEFDAEAEAAELELEGQRKQEAQMAMLRQIEGERQPPDPSGPPSDPSDRPQQGEPPNQQRAA